MCIALKMGQSGFFALRSRHVTPSILTSTPGSTVSRGRRPAPRAPPTRAKPATLPTPFEPHPCRFPPARAAAGKASSSLPGTSFRPRPARRRPKPQTARGRPPTPDGGSDGFGPSRPGDWAAGRAGRRESRGRGGSGEPSRRRQPGPALAPSRLPSPPATLRETRRRPGDVSRRRTPGFAESRRGPWPDRGWVRGTARQGGSRQPGRRVQVLACAVRPANGRSLGVPPSRAGLAFLWQDDRSWSFNRRAAGGGGPGRCNLVLQRRGCTKQSINVDMRGGSSAPRLFPI